MRIQRSTIVITGVTRGLGRAMVDEFVRRGHIVLGCARTGAQINRLAHVHPEGDFQTVNIASDSQVKAWASRLLKSYGPPDFVLNNAAILNRKASLWCINSRDFSTQIDVNIKGPVNVIRHFIPPMIDRKTGVVLNFTSRWGISVERNMGPYCATKWALVALTRVLAEELRPDGVAAIALNPGIVKTEMLRRYLGGRTLEDSTYMSPVTWARIAVPLILRLRLRDSGAILTIPIKPHSHLDKHSFDPEKP